MVIRNKNYDQILVAIRELIMDVSPVQSFSVKKATPGFSFSKSDTQVIIDSVPYAIGSAEVLKIYHLMPLLIAKGASVDVLPDHVALELTSSLQNFNFLAAALEAADGATVSRSNYFSAETIDGVIEDFFNMYQPPLYWDNVPREVSSIVNTLDYLDTRKLAYWTAYYLIDRKRMLVATSSVAQKKNTFSTVAPGSSGGGCDDDASLVNKERTVTMKIGDSFTVTETNAKQDEQPVGLTSIWGDNYEFLTKLQLYLRDRYERLFRDYSLRDNVAVSTTVTLEKGWTPFAYYDTHDLSQFTRDILT
jgi:hypothetical protein